VYRRCAVASADRVGGQSACSLIAATTMTSYRRLVRKRGVKPVIARRESGHGSGLGRERWIVERTFAWLHNRRRLLLRTDRRHEIHEAFLALACCLICWRRLENSLS